MAKILAADVWVILDNVQFARRDFQHRARLGSAADGGHGRWLTVPTHLPNGRATLIREARVVEAAQSRRRVEGVLREHYRTSHHWPHFAERLGTVLELFESTDRTAVIAEASTRLLLEMLGWRGSTVYSSALNTRPGRSRRLVDLCREVGASRYLCGTGGIRYVEPGQFADAGVELRPFAVPSTGVWTGARSVSAVHSLMVHGPTAVRQQVEALRLTVGRSPGEPCDADFGTSKSPTKFRS